MVEWLIYVGESTGKRFLCGGSSPVGEDPRLGAKEAVKEHLEARWIAPWDVVELVVDRRVHYYGTARNFVGNRVVQEMGL